MTMSAISSAQQKAHASRPTGAAAAPRRRPRRPTGQQRMPQMTQSCGCSPMSLASSTESTALRPGAPPAATSIADGGGASTPLC
jgi:hypothetical protein